MYCYTHSAASSPHQRSTSVWWIAVTTETTGSKCTEQGTGEYSAISRTCTLYSVPARTSMEEEAERYEKEVREK